MATLTKRTGIQASPDGQNTLNPHGAYGGCSTHFLNGFYPQYGENMGAKPKYKIPHSVAMTVAITTDGQEEDEVLVEELKAAGYVKILGCRTVHGVYDCNLWVCEPRGKGELNLPKPAYSIRLNPELFGGGGNAKAQAALEKQRAEQVKLVAVKEAELVKLAAKYNALEDKLDEAKKTIAEQKIALSQKRLLRKRKTSLNPTDMKGQVPLIPRRKGLSSGMRSKRPSV